MKDELAKLLEEFLAYKGKTFGTGAGVLQSREAEIQIVIVLTELLLWLKGETPDPTQN